jgi:hypothetical protein
MKVTARQLKAFNAFATIAWIVLIIPTLVWWAESILWVALMSIWANVVGHFSAYVAARSEKASEEQTSS